MRIFKSAGITAAFLALVACQGSTTPAPTAQARIVLNTESPRPTIDVVDIPAEQLGRIYGTDSREAWTAILKITAGSDQPPAVGQYTIEGEHIRFTPMFPLDHGKQYHVTFAPPGGQPITATVGLPPADTTPTTIVTQVYPTATAVPENLSRFYLEFSAPMERRGALDVVHLLDGTGQELKDAFLSLDADAWNDERTQYTVDLDGTRNPLNAGQSYTLVVDARWLDGHGRPLKQPFRRTFTAVTADDKAIDPKTWTIETPAAGSTDPLRVTLREPLDHELLMRALTVLAPNGRPLEGEAIIGPEESTWEFTPDQPWKTGSHNLAAAAMLEDVAGNRIAPAAEKTLIPFSVR